MKKLIRGIVDFRKNARPGYREVFAKLALGQKPDALFIACSDSRVAPNVFASTDPGDLFVLRNVGNIVPPCGPEGMTQSDESEWAAIEFAIETLKVKDIIVCGHSECGAMCALVEGREKVTAPHLRSWLRHGEPALGGGAGPKDANEVSRQNVLLQLEHLMTYEVVRRQVEKGALGLHAWWFDIAKAEVLGYRKNLGWVLIDESEAEIQGSVWT